MRGEKSGRDDWNEPTKADLIERIEDREFRKEAKQVSATPTIEQFMARNGLGPDDMRNDVGWGGIPIGR